MIVTYFVLFIFFLTTASLSVSLFDFTLVLVAGVNVKINSVMA